MYVYNIHYSYDYKSIIYYVRKHIYFGNNKFIIIIIKIQRFVLLTLWKTNLII